MSIDNNDFRNGPVATMGSAGPAITGDLKWGISEVPDDYSCEAIPHLFCWILPDHQRERARHLAGLTASRRK